MAQFLRIGLLQRSWYHGLQVWPPHQVPSCEHRDCLGSSVQSFHPSPPVLCLSLFPFLSQSLSLKYNNKHTKKKTRVEINTQRHSVPMRVENGINLRMKWQIQSPGKLTLSGIRNTWAGAKENHHCMPWEPSWQDACYLRKRRKALGVHGFPFPSYQWIEVAMIKG